MVVTVENRQFPATIKTNSRLEFSALTFRYTNNLPLNSGVFFSSKMDQHTSGLDDGGDGGKGPKMV